jgi:hypothetical protein
VDVLSDRFARGAQANTPSRFLIRLIAAKYLQTLEESIHSFGVVGADMRRRPKV